MKIEVFAILKDYFDKEFEITREVPDISSLKYHLTTINPGSADIIAMCRFASHDEFVEDDHLLSSSDSIAIIPPSSGG